MSITSFPAITLHSDIQMKCFQRFIRQNCKVHVNGACELFSIVFRMCKNGWIPSFCGDGQK
ncbi:CLUMA_CG002192, isoform A [Clunio marinus]|uniref:CLUMA_CG002192, isoform A n=1 Tax=Clunio marinus TaxID=568069 RepID=A0A1J1HLY0_9DIPT|nr:CLUMA_CG002192, isoform A [Clunio marinus]